MSNEEIRRDVYSDEGMLVGFFQIASSIQPAFTGLYVRGDWLEELGLSQALAAYQAALERYYER